MGVHYSHYKWTEEQTSFFINNFQNKTCQEMSVELGIPLNSIKSKRKYLGLVKSKDALQKIYSRPNAGHFSKGQLPFNTLEDNKITGRIDKNGNVYQWIRISLAKWEMLHIHLWKSAGRTIPKGHVVAFKDKDNTNCVLENLILLTKGENLMQNRKQYLEKKHIERQVELQIKLASKAEKKLKTEIERQKLKMERLTQMLSAAKKTKAPKVKRSASPVLKPVKQNSNTQLHFARRMENNKRIERQKFAAVTVDYSQMVTIRIDAKTVIYSKPGEEEATKARFLKHYSKPIDRI